MKGEAMDGGAGVGGDMEGDVKVGVGGWQHSSKHKVPTTNQNPIPPVFIPREPGSLFRLLTEQCLRTHRHIGDLNAATVENVCF